MDLTVGPLGKRPRDRHSRDESSFQEQIISDDGLSYVEDSWGQGPLFALDAPPASDSVCSRNGTQYQSFDQERKRDYSSLAASDGLYEPPWLDTSSPLQAQEWWLQNHSQEISPSVPWEQNHWVDLTTPNPFAEDSVNRYSSIRSTRIKPPQGVIDSYVKVQFWTLDGTAVPVVAPRYSALHPNPVAVHHRNLPYIPGGNANIPRLPPDFGRELKLGQLDSKLFKFYTVAYCRGRTLLRKTNFWLVDIAPMASGNAVGSLCVKHAILSLAAPYLLDYAPSEILRKRANFHYRRAVELLSHAYRDPETEGIEKGDSVIGALILLMSNDIVNWELRRPKGREPRWRGGSRIAKSILTKSNPSRWYQRSSARISYDNWVAYINILTQSVTPLKIEDTKCDYPWLLAGSEREQRKIHGGTGVCPKILHTFAQITHLAAFMAQTPDSMIIPHGAEEIEQRLIDFRQFSDLSDGYQTRQALLDSCRLNFDGKVNCPAKVTELTAETWVAAAQIYLYCRFFRKPRSAAVVATNLDVLLRCVERMPTSGPLFTSQSPFFPIFLAGLVSYRDQDRQVIRNWFETIVAEARCKSSVPPVWRALQSIWQWMDTGLVEDPDDDQQAIGQKRAWWEEMVAKLIEQHGEINLC